MKSKKLVVLLSALVLATAPAVVAATGCDTTPNTPPPAGQTNEYTFKFAGGTGATGTAPEDVVKKTDETFTLPSNTFEKAGYTFAGWSDGTASTPYAAGATYTAGTANVTFTAVWTAIDYKVTFAGGTGATGTVAEITGKHIGDKVTLPANGFTKTGHDFVGWSVDGKTYGVGAEITIGTSNVTATAVWFEAGVYLDSINAGSSVTFTDGKATFTVKADYGDDTYSTLYDYTITDGAIVFADPEDETDAYTGVYENGILAVALPVRISNYAINSTPFVLAKAVLAPIDDVGTNGYSQTYERTNPIYMFENGVIAATTAETVNYRKVYTVKLGTYKTVSLHTYSVTYYGDAKSYELKIELTDGISFYKMNDGLNGTYTFGTESVTLNGYGSFNGGTYDVVTDGTNSMLVLNYTTGGATKLCEVSGSTLTEITAAGAGVYSYTGASQWPTFKNIYYNGSNLAGFVIEEGDDDHITTRIIAATIDGNKEIEVPLNGWESAKVKFSQGAFKVKGDSGYGAEEVYTLGGAEFVEPLPEGVTDGAYIDNMHSDITASIATENGIMKLTLSKGGSSAVYKVSAGDKAGEVLFKLENTSTVKTGYIVNGVIYVAGVKAGTASTTYHVALTKEALTTVSGAAAGYYAKPGSTTYALYLYTNGVAVYRTGNSSSYQSGKIATYTKDGDDYVLTFPDGTASKIFRTVADEGETAAYYIEGVGFKGNYTIGGDTYALDGFGNYTKGSETGTYTAGAKGFTLVKDNAVIGVYTVTDGVVAEASETVTKNNAGGNANTALKNRNFYFKTAEVYTGCGCAIISYSIGETGEVKTVKVAVGMTLTIEGELDGEPVTENFTVTTVSDESVNLLRTNTDGSVASNAKNLTFGAAG